MIELNKINNFGVNYIARIRKRIKTKDKKLRKGSVKMEERNIINYKVNILKIAMLLFMVFLAIPNTSFASSIITADPKTTTVNENTNATFSVSATGSNLSYLWLYKKPIDNFEWTEIPSTLANGMNTNTLTVKNVTLDYQGYAFRCLVTSSTTEEISNIAYLYVENSGSVQKKITPNYRLYGKDGVYYATLADAYAEITGTTETIIVELDNEDSSTLTIESGKNITIDTNGKTLTKLSTQITNNGTLSITGNGTIQTAETDKNVLDNLIMNNGTLNVNDATLISNVRTGTGNYTTITNNSILNINSGTIKSQITSGKNTGGYLRTIYQKSGTTNINGGTITCDYNGTAENDYAILSYTTTNAAGNININGGVINSADRGVGISSASGYNNSGKLTMNGGNIIAVQHAIYHDSNCTGDFVIAGGTIKSNNGRGIYNYTSAKLIIGSKGGNISINNPSITGKTCAVSSNSEFYFYDGILKGATNSYNGTIKEIEPNCMRYESTEVIDSTTYKTLILLTDVKDITPPVGEINVLDSTYKDKIYHVNDKNITVSITATDDLSQSEEIKLYITFDEIDLTNKIPENAWESYYEGYTKKLTIPDIMVTNRIYVIFKDGTGNISAAFTGTNVECTVNFNVNGGTGSIPSRKGVYGTACILPEETPVRSGKYFYGWNTNASATVALYKPGGIIPASAFNDSTNITLYAIYGDNPLLADVVKVGDYIDFPVYYNDVTGNANAKNNSWIVKSTNVDINGNNSAGVVNIISKGIPLVANASATDNEIINDVLNMTTTSGASKYIKNGFVSGQTLKEIFTNKYVTLESGLTPKVKAEVKGDNVYIIVSLKPTVRTSGKDGMNNWKLEQEITSSLVSFLPNGAGASVSQANKSVYYNSAYGTLPTPTRAGYDFLGWYTTSGNIRKVTSSSIVETIVGHSLEASWQARNDTEYKVEHWQQTVTGGATQNNTNYVLKETDTLKGTTDTNVTPAVKNYTGFTAPTTQTVSILGDGTRVVKYYYTRNSYELTLDKNSYVDSVSSGGRYRYGATVNISATVGSATGYIYSWVNWTSNNTSLHANVSAQNTSITMPAGNLTLTANGSRTPKTILVTFNRNTTSSDTTTATQTFTYDVSGQSFSAKGWTRYGYELIGWSFDRNATSETYSVLSGVSNDWINTNSPSCTLYAVWEIKSFAITGQASTGGTVNVPSIGVLGETITIKATANSGYHFVNWTVVSGGVTVANSTSATTTFTMPENAVTIKANFAAHSFTFSSSAHSKSCSNCGYTETHTASWSSTYTQTETTHYKACTVSGCKLTTSSGSHSYSGQSCTAGGTCVCGRSGTALGHSYSTSYTYDSSTHWKACTRSGCSSTTSSGYHSYSGQNCTSGGTCVCGRTGTALNHSYSTTYSSDSSTHWKSCTRSGCSSTTSSGYHSYSGQSCTSGGTCVCGRSGSSLGHSYSTSYSYDSSTHWKSCTRSGCSSTTSSGYHSYSGQSCTSGGTCVCGRSGSTLSHSYSYECSTALTNAGCTKAKCTSCGATTGSHIRACETCPTCNGNKTISCSGTFTSGTCSCCGGPCQPAYSCSSCGASYGYCYGQTCGKGGHSYGSTGVHNGKTCTRCNGTGIIAK